MGQNVLDGENSHVWRRNRASFYMAYKIGNPSNKLQVLWQAK
jgi:hypothetical protein